MRASLSIGLVFCALLFTLDASAEDPADVTPEQQSPSSVDSAPHSPLPPPPPPPAGVTALTPQRPQKREVPPFIEVPPSEPVMDWSWYGWQTLIVDGASLLLLTGTDDGTGPAVGTYLIGPPIVHWSHGNVGRGFASLGLRVGAPLTLGLAFGGSCEESPYSHGTCIDDFAVGFLVGVGSAVLLDAFALSWEKQPRKGSSASVGKLALTPAVSRDGQSGMVMATGTF